MPDVLWNAWLVIVVLLAGALRFIAVNFKELLLAVSMLVGVHYVIKDAIIAAAKEIDRRRARGDWV